MKTVTPNDYSLTEPEIGGVLRGYRTTLLRRIVTAFCIVKNYSNYGKFKILVESVLRGHDEIDFEVKFLKRFNKTRNGFEFPDREDIASDRRSEIVNALSASDLDN